MTPPSHRIGSLWMRFRRASPAKHGAGSISALNGPRCLRDRERALARGAHGAGQHVPKCRAGHVLDLQLC